MWKLTITQKCPVEGYDFTTDKAVVFYSEELSELTLLIERLAHCNAEHETEWKIEKVGDE